MKMNASKHSESHDSCTGLGLHESFHTTEELIKIHYNVLSALLEKVVAQRFGGGSVATVAAPCKLEQNQIIRNQEVHECGKQGVETVCGDSLLVRRFRYHRRSNSTAMDEISDTVYVPDLHASSRMLLEMSHSSENLDECYDYNGEEKFSCRNEERSFLSRDAKSQLRLYITRIAELYLNKNPFHNFEHASHVTFSTFQLVQRVVGVTPTTCLYKNDDTSSSSSSDAFDKANETRKRRADPWKQLPSPDLKRSTDILSSNCLAQFALVFSALIHDVDHRGVPNTQLASEDPKAAAKYKHKSIAEQKSVDVAWDLLEEDCFSDLRAAIFSTEAECAHFRNMIVNVVLATDICDPGLKKYREMKWERAFSNGSIPVELTFSDDEDKNDNDRSHFSGTGDFVSLFSEERSRKASVAMDLIIQAADISHTMQPFEIYLQWNIRLYHEMYVAFLEGRSSKDPTEGWYEGELIFYDKHIIPLAIRLKESAILGPAGDILLDNAFRNRAEWEMNGRELSKQMIDLIAREIHGDEAEAKIDPSRGPAASESIISWPAIICCKAGQRWLHQHAEGKKPIRLSQYGKNIGEEISETEEESDDESGVGQSLRSGRTKTIS